MYQSLHSIMAGPSLLCRYYISCWYAADRTTVPYTVIETGITVSQVSMAAVMAAVQYMKALVLASGNERQARGPLLRLMLASTMRERYDHRQAVPLCLLCC